jgi:hypothetical protein
MLGKRGFRFPDPFIDTFQVYHYPGTIFSEGNFTSARLPALCRASHNLIKDKIQSYTVLNALIEHSQSENMPIAKTKLRTVSKVEKQRAKTKRAKAKRGLPPSTFGKTPRGKRERFRNRKETMCRKTLEIYNKCGTHALTIIKHPLDGSLVILDTRKGSGSVWPKPLQDFVS